MRFRFRAVALAGLLVPLPASASITELDLGGFAIELTANVPGSPEVVYDAMTGDVSGWWDHHFSENPKALYIEAKPGGGFYEIFDESGDGAKHAEVIFAQRGKLLRLQQVDHRVAARATDVQPQPAVAHRDPDRVVGEAAGRGHGVIDDRHILRQHEVRALGV